MPDDVNSSGAIEIRPEIKAEGSNSSDSNASSQADQTLRNEFAEQTLEVQGVQAGASFAPVSLNVNPVIKGSGGVSASLNNPMVWLGAAGAAGVAMLLLWKRKGGKHGYYRCVEPLPHPVTYG